MDKSQHERDEKEVSFPSPARDFWEAPLSLDKECGLSNPSVFLLRYQGAPTSSIQTGAILVVDRSLKPTHQDTVVLVRGGELELYGYKHVPEEEGIELWGTVTHAMNKLKTSG